MLKTTTSTVDGKPIETYLDVVVGEAILGANVFKDIFMIYTRNEFHALTFLYIKIKALLGF